MTTADKIAAIFAVATDNFTLISGQPTDDDINTMEKALLPLLHDIDYNMYGPQNLIGIIEPPIIFTVTWGQAFVCPPRPTAYDLNILDNVTRSYVAVWRPPTPSYSKITILTSPPRRMRTNSSATVLKRPIIRISSTPPPSTIASRPRTSSFTSEPTAGVSSPKISSLYKH